MLYDAIAALNFIELNKNISIISNNNLSNTIIYIL